MASSLSYPSAKLGPVTRLKNRINKATENMENINVQELELLKTELKKKIMIFETACKDESVKEGVDKEEMEDFINWHKRHEIANKTFVTKLELLICKNSEFYEDSDGDSEIETNTPSSTDRTSQLLESILKMQSVSKLPKNEPKPFGGTDVTEYRSFMLTFEKMIEQYCVDFDDKFYYLMKYTIGEAHQLVNSCYSDDGEKSYRDAKALLEKQYGNEYVIAQKYLDKLQNWPVIKAEEGESLRKFASFLTLCNNMMGKMRSLNQLDSWRDIKEIIMKLPWSLRTHFRNQAQARMKANKIVDFEFLVSFVNEQSEILNFPLLGDISDRSKERKIPVSKRVLVTKGDVSADSHKYCHCCRKENHGLNDCFFFSKKSLKDRQFLIRKWNLCFGCLNSSDHRSKDCPSRLSCKICKSNHPSCLHRAVERPDSVNINNGQHFDALESPSITSMVSKQRKRVVLPTVAAILRSKVSSKYVRTYVALDYYSSGNYMNYELLNLLGIDGRSKELELKTIEHVGLKVNTVIAEGLELVSLNGDKNIPIGSVYAKKNWHFDRKDSPSNDDVEGYPALKRVPINYIDSDIGILIGMNEPQLLKPLEIIETSKNGPYASRHELGWVLNGPVKKDSSSVNCFRTKVADVKDLDSQINSLFGADFSDSTSDLSYSVDQNSWLECVKRNTKKFERNFEISLPFKKVPFMPNNYCQIYSRLMAVSSKLRNDSTLMSEYCNFMKMMRDREFVERVPTDEISTANGQTWFLAHHGVRHKKKGKLRIVFDCSLKFNGTSLNEVLWSGPDLANPLVGVLLKFRLERFAITADIEKMYHMIKLPREDRDYLRFLWYEDDDLNKKPVQYRLTVHLFGAITSSSIANFALRECVKNEENSRIKDVVTQNFYVDDLLASFQDELCAVDIIQGVVRSLDFCGFNLTSFASNSAMVLSSLPGEKMSVKVKDMDLSNESYFERALGMKWDVHNDTIKYELSILNQPDTKRGVLSTIFSIYDPLFIAAPAFIRAKRLFQIACAKKLSWDDPLPADLKRSWIRWKTDIAYLENFKVPRCYKTSLDEVIDTQLHIFADGSEVAYGSVAYFRFEYKNGTVSSAIIMSRARLTPIDKKSLKTVPRIELNAAKLAVKLYETIYRELKEFVVAEQTFFWTDSMSTLQYIKSENKQFQRFVANRVAYIRSRTDVSSWNHVPGASNPADLISRGIGNVKEFSEGCKMWTEGPMFLRQAKDHWPAGNMSEIPGDDPEIKVKQFCLATDNVSMSGTGKLMESVSDIHRLKCRIATILRLKRYLYSKECEKGPFKVTELDVAELEIIKYYQRLNFVAEIKLLERGKFIGRNNPLNKFNPFLDTAGVLRVGGRLGKCDLPFDLKHPIILHGDSMLSRMLISEIHTRGGHLGREFVLTKLKERYHIVKANTVLRSLLRRCVLCRKTQARCESQIMADLPVDRVAVDLPPFSKVGTDVFGPFYVTRGRAQEKRYGIIFTCLTSRATHIEITPGLDTSSYINSLRRFIARRGSPKTVRSDNGTNLTSADKELRDSINSWNKCYLQEFGLQHKIDWIFNPPYASHFGGVFERQIRTIRKIFNSVLREFSNQTRLTDDMLHTLFCEIENIMNSQPLTAVTTEADGIEPITPNHLLRLQSNVPYPPGLFEDHDLYSKKRWRQVQFLASVFWKRFVKEYVPLLNARSRWTMPKDSLEIDDIVLVMDPSLPRNFWSLGRVVSTKPDERGFVRTVSIKLPSKDSNKVIMRPIHKLVLICRNKK